jgi:hypothetical protein
VRGQRLAIAIGAEHPDDPRLFGKDLCLEQAKAAAVRVAYDLSQKGAADPEPLPRVLDQQADLGDALCHPTTAC